MAGLFARDGSAAGQVRGYAEAFVMVAASTIVGLIVAPRWGNSAVDLLYLPAVLATAVLAGLGPALAAAAASALAYNFFFTAPHLTFRIDNPNDVVTVLVLFAVALVTSQLAASIRRQARIAEGHAARNATIAGLARHLLGCTGEQEIAEVTSRELAAIFECNALLVGNGQAPRILASAPTAMRLTPSDVAAAALTLGLGERTGRGLDRAVPTEWQFHPVRSRGAILAAAALARDDGAPAIRADQLALLDNLLDQVALALERSRLEGQARELTRERERDRIRAVLVATIAQDLNPSLAAIGGAVRALRRSGGGDKESISTVAAEAAKLERYVANLADLGVQADHEPLHAGGVTIDLLHRAVSRDGAEVHLTPKEYAVLAELAKHPGRVLTHAHLLRTAWGPAQEGQTEYLRVAVRGLRQKLERDPSHPELILNEPAVGYRLRTTQNV
jgi:two-component system sensor histidine kinase KdpD